MIYRLVAVGTLSNCRPPNERLRAYCCAPFNFRHEPTCDKIQVKVLKHLIFLLEEHQSENRDQVCQATNDGMHRLWVSLLYSNAVWIVIGLRGKLFPRSQSLEDSSLIPFCSDSYSSFRYLAPSCNQYIQEVHINSDGVWYPKERN